MKEDQLIALMAVLYYGMSRSTEWADNPTIPEAVKVAIKIRTETEGQCDLMRQAFMDLGDDVFRD